MTGGILIDDPTSPGVAETTTTHISTTTVTSKTRSTNSITATATVLASSCPTTTDRNIDQSVPLTREHTTSTVGGLTDSNSPAVSPHLRMHSCGGLPESGPHVAHASSHNRIHGSGAVSSQSPSSLLVKRLNKMLSPLSVSDMEVSSLSSLAAGISHKGSSTFLSRNKTKPVANVRPTEPTRIASTSHSDRGNIAIRRPAGDECEADQTLLPRDLAKVAGTRKPS